MRNFVVHSDNKALLLAFYDTCVELGMPVDETWNIKYKDRISANYICFEQGDEIQFQREKGPFFTIFTNSNDHFIEKRKRSPDD